MNAEFWRGRKVLVTGHTGFKGAWLCLLLSRLGAQVLGYALQPPTTPSLFALARVDELVASLNGDVRYLPAVERAILDFEPEVVLHMAAQSVVLNSYDDPVETYTSNVIGTVNVLEAVRRSRRPTVLINVTTDKCYRNNGWVWGYRETDALGGRDPYSNSKACAELVTSAYRESFFPPVALSEHRVVLATARAGNVIGGGDWTPHQLIPELVRSYERGETAVLRNPHAVRPWQHVLDCVSGYLALAEACSEDPARFGGEWNFGPFGTESYTVARVAELLARHWGVSPPWQTTKSTKRPEEHELRLDCSKVERELGWRPSLDLADAVAWVAEWHMRATGGESPRAVSLRQIGTYLAKVQPRPSSAPSDA